MKVISGLLISVAACSCFAANTVNHKNFSGEVQKAFLNKPVSSLNTMQKAAPGRFDIAKAQVIYQAVINNKLLMERLLKKDQKIISCMNKGKSK